MNGLERVRIRGDQTHQPQTLKELLSKAPFTSHISTAEKVACWKERSSGFNFKNGQGIESSFPEKISEACKKQMGMSEEEKGTTEQRFFLEKVAQAVTRMLEEIGAKEPDLKKIKDQISLVSVNSYELISYPTMAVSEYLQRPHERFFYNQHHIRRQLSQEVSPKLSEVQHQIFSSITNGMSGGNINQVKTDLLQKYPTEEAVIVALSEKAETLMDEIEKRAKRELGPKDPEVVEQLNRIFSKHAELEEKYVNQLNGRYSFPCSPPSVNPMYETPSYFPRLLALLRGCQEFETASDQKEALGGLAQRCGKYKKEQVKSKLFQENIEPLLLFFKTLVDIEQSPLTNDPTYSLQHYEKEYLVRKLYLFLTVANQSLVKRVLIPYQYTSIAEEEKKCAEATLKSKKSTSEQKREASRLLLHSNIPWQALQIMAGFLHSSGGVSEEVAKKNREQLFSMLPQLLPDLSKARKAIGDLIAFEAEEFEVDPTVCSSPFVFSSYPVLSSLQIARESKDCIQKIVNTLSCWENASLPQPLSNTDKFALLRTIQVLGEMSKHLRGLRVLGEDPLWKNVEDLRDLFCHPERISVFKRLEELLLKQDEKILRQIIYDFSTLAAWFREKLNHIVQLEKGKKEFIEAEGIEDLYIYLTAKISKEQRLILEKSVFSQEAVKARDAMRTATHTYFDNQSDYAVLPLTKVQKKVLEEGRKVFSSQKAAENNTRNAKLGMCQVIENIVKELKKDKEHKLEEIQHNLTAFQNEIAVCKEKIDEEGFDATVTTARQSFQNIVSKLSQSSKDQKQTIEENLKNLTETVEEFKGRKKSECRHLLEELPIAKDEEQAKQKGAELIRNMPLGKTNKELVGATLKELGLTFEKEKEWNVACDACFKVQANVPNEQKRGSCRERAFSMIQTIRKRLHELDLLFIAKTQESLQKDLSLQLASQYLAGDMRRAASALESLVEELTPFLEKKGVSLGFIDHLKQDLNQIFLKGNEIAHLHDVTELGTTTIAGKVFFFHQYLRGLLQNISLVRGGVLPSFSERLEVLEKVLKKA